MKRSLAFFALVLAAVAQALAQDGPGIDFARDVRPLLSRHCFACHGPDEKAREADLRLDVRESAVADRGDYAAVVPGHASESEVHQRLTAEEDDFRMPPPETGHVLSPGQIELVRRWIDAGAPYRPHWAFVKPSKPAVPAVGGREWVRNPIDAFVAARLQQAGLGPSPPADRYTLIRRLSLDLIGLPPTPAQAEELVRDESEDAVERVVDRLLASPAFGERWASVWLDLARYADSCGYGSDPLREIWRYRDWVIGALNRNLPYDRFTVEQLAGDLLPNPTVEERLATAFHRNTMTNTEGGTDDEEFRVAAVKDRATTTAQVWMGLTLGCAECHAHKFDPITHEEYYRFLAFFNQTEDHDQPDDRPRLETPTAAQRAEVERLESEIAAAAAELAAPSAELAAELAVWERAHRDARWQPIDAVIAASARGARIERAGEGILQVTGEAAERDVYLIEAEADLTGLTALRLDVLPGAAPGDRGLSRAGGNGNIVLNDVRVLARPASAPSRTIRGRYVRIDLPGRDRILSLAEVEVWSGADDVARRGTATQSSIDHEGRAARAIDGLTSGAYEHRSVTHTRAEAGPWWEVDLGKSHDLDRIVVWNRTDGELEERLRGFNVVVTNEDGDVVLERAVRAAPRPRHVIELVPGTVELELTEASADFAQEGWPVARAIDGDPDPGSGWALAPRTGEAHHAVFETGLPAALRGPVRLSVRLVQSFGAHHTMSRLGLAWTTAAPPVRVVPPEVGRVLAKEPASRSGVERDLLADFFRTIAPSRRQQRRHLSALRKSRSELDVATTPVMRELPPGERRQTHVHVGGSFLRPGKPVEPGTPAALHAFPKDAPANRLGLARWLVSPENPLTARVAVNRVWAGLFGVGLVETEEDFGSQGSPPSHPWLLDWLAVTFVESGWDLKALIRTIVTSATYRQDSTVRAEHLRRDPRNRLLSRGARIRLRAEMVRDQALAVSGLLSRKMLGPSVYPPQPAGLWQAAFNEADRTWPTSKGEDRYRRALYTFLRRTVPYPSLSIFDHPSRETCTMRRMKTSTPLQPLVTMNDPVFVEAAQALARRILREGGSDAESRARYGLVLCTLRPPRDEPVRELVDLAAAARADFETRPDDAARLATDPLGPLPAGLDAAEAAAWCVVASVLLNLDAMLVRS